MRRVLSSVSFSTGYPRPLQERTQQNGCLQGRFKTARKGRSRRREEAELDFQSEIRLLTSAATNRKSAVGCFCCVWSHFPFRFLLRVRSSNPLVKPLPDSGSFCPVPQGIGKNPNKTGFSTTGISIAWKSTDEC